MPSTYAPIVIAPNGPDERYFPTVTREYGGIEIDNCHLIRLDVIPVPGRSDANIVGLIRARASHRGTITFRLTRTGNNIDTPWYETDPKSYRTAAVDSVLRQRLVP